MNQEKILDAILTKVVTMEEKMGAFATKDDIVQVKDEILGNVDRYCKAP